MTHTEKLLPCPFCGGEAYRITLDESIVHETSHDFGGDVIQCGSCECSSRVFFGEKEGVEEAWNTRAALPAPAEPTDDERAAALDDMPDIVGTPDTSAYKKSMERLLEWYDAYYLAIRKALQPRSVRQVEELNIEKAVSEIDDNLGGVDPHCCETTIERTLKYLSDKYSNGLRIVKSGERG